MPNYDYQCNNCGHIFEAFQNINDKLLNKCPECKKNTLRRLIGAGAGVIFKGGGFYATDYKKQKPLKKCPAAPSANSPCSGCPKAADSSANKSQKKD